MPARLASGCRSWCRCTPSRPRPWCRPWRRSRQRRWPPNGYRDAKGADPAGRRVFQGNQQLSGPPSRHRRLGRGERHRCRQHPRPSHQPGREEYLDRSHVAPLGVPRSCGSSLGLGAGAGGAGSVLARQVGPGQVTEHVRQRPGRGLRQQKTRGPGFSPPGDCWKSSRRALASDTWRNPAGMGTVSLARFCAVGWSQVMSAVCWRTGELGESGQPRAPAGTCPG